MWNQKINSLCLKTFRFTFIHKIIFSIIAHPFKLSFQLSLVDTAAIRKKSLFLRGAGDCALANKALNSSFQLTLTQGLGFWETAHLPLP